MRDRCVKCKRCNINMCTINNFLAYQRIIVQFLLLFIIAAVAVSRILSASLKLSSAILPNSDSSKEEPAKLLVLRARLSTCINR